MENQRFVLPLTMSNKAYFVEAEIRVVKNKSHKNFGEVSIYTDMHYDLISNRKRYMTFSEAFKLLTEHGFIQVSDDFDQDSIKSLRSIKSHLSKKWVECYNLWSDFSG